MEKRVDCIVESLDGRIILFTDCKSLDDILGGIRGIISHHPVRIFEDLDSLVEAILPNLQGCRDFAIRSNRKSLEGEIGGRVVDALNIPVNLTSPHCRIYVERRGKFYLLFLEYP